MKKLAIVTSHPIQYNAPLFRMLTERGRVAVRVFYTWGQTESGLVYDPDFQQEFKWDIPLLDGYDKEFVENISAKPGAGHFSGIKNKDLIQRIDRFDPDSLLVFGWSFHSHLQVLRHYQGKKKILFRGDSTLLDEPPGFALKKMLRRVFLRWVYRHVDVALYTGEANQQYYRAHGVKDGQLVYAGHAVENERFYDPDGKQQEAANRWRKKLGIQEEDPVFLFAGKLEPKKDPGLLIRAFSALSLPKARLLLVGKGVLEEELKREAAGDERILFLGFQNQQQMPVVYRMADVFVLPSKGPGETWGLSVNEAMACGRAVIVSDQCGCADELVRDNGLVFQAGQVEQLQDAIHRMVTDPDGLKKMKTESIKQIHQFRFEKVAEAIESIH